MDLDHQRKKKLLFAFVLFDVVVVGAVLLWFFVLREEGPDDADARRVHDGGRRPRAARSRDGRGATTDEAATSPSDTGVAESPHPEAPPVPLVVVCVEARTGAETPVRGIHLIVGSRTIPLDGAGTRFRLDDSPYRHGERADARLVVDAGPDLAAFSSDLDATVGWVDPRATEVRATIPLWPAGVVEREDPENGTPWPEPRRNETAGDDAGREEPVEARGLGLVDVEALARSGEPAATVVLFLDSGRGRRLAITDEAGRATFDRVAAGDHEIEAIGARFLPTTTAFAVRASERVRVVVREAEGAFTTVRVYGTDDRVAPAVAVSVLPREGWGYVHVVDGVQHVVARTDARGEIRLGPLPPSGVFVAAVSGARSGTAIADFGAVTPLRLMTPK